MNIKTTLASWFKQRFYNWLDKRQPASDEVILRQHLLFVFPTAFGGWFILLICLLYLFGSNYQNNLILLSAYLLLALFCFCILASFFNLYLLIIKASRASYSFAGTPLQLELDLSQKHPGKMVRFSGYEFDTVHCDILPQRLQLQLRPRPRGYYHLSRFTLESRYPFGLIRCWTHIQMKQAYWIYPEPMKQHPNMMPSKAMQHDTPDQLAPFQAGATTSAIDWKRLAKNPWYPVIRLSSATTDPQQLQRLVVNTKGAALESQLSEFCALLQHMEQQGQSYSLSTPRAELGPDSGLLHLHRCLQALSLC